MGHSPEVVSPTRRLQLATLLGVFKWSSQYQHLAGQPPASATVRIRGTRKRPSASRLSDYLLSRCKGRVNSGCKKLGYASILTSNVGRRSPVIEELLQTYRVTSKKSAPKNFTSKPITNTTALCASNFVAHRRKAFQAKLGNATLTDIQNSILAYTCSSS